VSQLGREKNLWHSKAKDRREVLKRAVSGLNSNFSDKECVGCTPWSDNESVHSIDDDNYLSTSMEDEDMEDEDDDFLEWMIFGESHEMNNSIESVDADCDDPSNSARSGVAAEEQSGSIDGLHWDTTFKIHDPPAGRKPTKGCSVKAQYECQFKTLLCCHSIHFLGNIL